MIIFRYENRDKFGMVPSGAWIPGRTFLKQLECGILKFPNWNRIWNRFYFWTYLYHSWSTAVSFVSFNRQL